MLARLAMFCFQFLPDRHTTILVDSLSLLTLFRLFHSFRLAAWERWIRSLLYRSLGTAGGGWGRGLVGGGGGGGGAALSTPGATVTRPFHFRLLVVIPEEHVVQGVGEVRGAGRGLLRLHLTRCI